MRHWFVRNIWLWLTDWNRSLRCRTEKEGNNENWSYLLSTVIWLPWQTTLSLMRPRRSVWSTPHKAGTLFSQRLCTFRLHADVFHTHIYTYIHWYRANRFTRWISLWSMKELVEQGLTSHSTQFRSFRRRCFYRSDDPTNSIKALKEGG